MEENCSENINEKLNYLKNFLLSGPFSQEQLQNYKPKVSKLLHDFKRKWVESSYRKILFLENNKSWLEGSFAIPISCSKQGRPEKSFEELCNRSKRRKTEKFRETAQTDELAYAVQMKLRESGNSAASKVLTEILKTPQRAMKYKKAYSDSLKAKHDKVTILEALSMFVESIQKTI